jgi:hypothetical protein
MVTIGETSRFLAWFAGDVRRLAVESCCCPVFPPQDTISASGPTFDQDLQDGRKNISNRRKRRTQSVSSSVLSVSFCSTSGAVHPDTPLSSMDGIVTEFVFEKPVRNPTSGFVGTIGCWTAIWKLRLTAACLSLGLMLLLAEIVLRCVTDFPVNTASNMIPHPQLGYVLDPRLDDVDANGFRNADVLQQADIVAIGDSQTQGFNAAAEGSWPQLLA